MATVSQQARSARNEASDPVTRSRADRLLRYTAILFITAVAIHGGDHAFRGIADQDPPVLVAGTLQAVLGVLTVRLVLRHHPGAPTAAIWIGFTSALLFAAAHLLPTWGFLSDSYVTPAADAGVTWFSWTTAVLEITADVAFGVAGLNALLQRRPVPRTAPTG